DDAVLVAAGVVTRTDGADLRRGSLIGPFGGGLPGRVGVARTPVRTWTLPGVVSLPMLFGPPPSTVHGGGPRPLFGAHPPGGYPPLAAPPGPPPSDVDG